MLSNEGRPLLYCPNDRADSAHISPGSPHIYVVSSNFIQLMSCLPGQLTCQDFCSAQRVEHCDLAVQFACRLLVL